MNETVSYTAVVLDKTSQEVLLSKTKHFIPEGWKVYAHQMTICMGAYGTRSDIGKRVVLTVATIAHNDSTVAVGVYGYPSENKVAHVTVAVNTAAGAKPNDSNLLTKWHSMYPIQLIGTIIEVAA